MRRSTSYRLMVVGCVVCILLNIAVSVFIFFKVRHPATYNVEYHEAPDLSRLSFPRFDIDSDTFVVSSNTVTSTNIVNSKISSRHSTNSLPRSVAKFSYGFVGDSAVLNGRIVSVGDDTAFGVVRSIFPERIILDDGSYIENRRYTNDNIRTN